jgi:hypothetical protein
MVMRTRRRKCRHCGKLFSPDPRNATRQRYCSQPQCRKASKASSQKRWLQRPQNQDYFRGPYNVERVQRWRKDHPGYWQRKPTKSPTALQEPLTVQPPENNDNRGDFVQHTLQDPLVLQPAVFIGLISQLTGYALQEDIARATRRLQQLGNDILNSQDIGGPYGKKTSDLSPGFA